MSRRQRVLWSILAGTALAAVPAPAGASPVQARADAPGLVSSVPADGAVLATAPDAVELTFSQPLDPSSSHLRVVDEAGDSVEVGEAAGEERTLRQPVRISAPGNLTVVYHVVFATGAEATGFLRFSVGTGIAPPAGGAVPSIGLDHSHGVDPVGAVLLLVDLAVVVGVLVLLRLRPVGRAPRTTA